MSTIVTRAGKGSPLTNTEVDANFTNLNADKLESSAYTAADVLTKIKTVDGATSGLDADLLDGIEAGSFLRSDTDDTATGNINFTGNLTKDNNTVWHNGNKTFYVATNTNTVAGVWKASISDITAYIDGQVIVFYPNKINGGSSATTFEINSLGVKNIKAPGSATSNLTTHYHGSNLILLRYNAGDDCFNVHADYNTTDDYRIRWNHGVTVSNSAGSGTAIHGYQLLMEGIDGKFYPVTEGGSTANTNPVSTAEFRVGGTIISYESTSDIAVNGTVGSNNLYESIYSGVMEYWNNRDSGWATAYRPVYLVATMNANGNFVLDNTSFTSFLTQDLPTSDDGKYYIDIGLMINTYDNYRLEVTHPIYVYKDNMVREWGGYANNADKLDDQTGSYYLDYSNFSNKPSNATTSVSGLMSSEDKTKLDGIESGADVTDATNVAAAGALMDSEVTNLAQVKAFDSADYATAAQGTTADNALPKAGGTMTGQLISTRANSTATGTGQIYLNGSTGNRIDFNTQGTAAPTTTTRSAGTKLVLYPTISASAVDYALGIESNTLWYSVPSNGSQFKWYGGTSNVMTLSGAGVLTATTFSGALSGNATTATTLQTARTINGVSFNGSADITVPVPPRAVAASGTSGTLSPNSDTTDIFNAFGLTGAVTFNVPTGTPVDGQRLVLRLRDSGSDQGLTWTTTSGGYRVIGTTLPSTTTASKLLYVGCIYNSTDSFWDVVAVTTEA